MLFLIFLILKVLKLKVCVFKSKYFLIKLYEVLMCILKVVSIYLILFLPKILSFLSLKYKLIDDLIISIEYIYI